MWCDVAQRLSASPTTRLSDPDPDPDDDPDLDFSLDLDLGPRSRPSSSLHQPQPRGRALVQPVKMRIPIREQLAGLILLAAAIGLAVISIATWYTSHNFILEIRTTRLSLTASLKAAQIASNLALIQNSVQLVSSRLVMQNALRRYNLQGNNTAANWLLAQSDFNAAIAGPASGAVGQALMLQGKIFPRDANGPNGYSSVLNATSENLETILLPYKAPNGSDVYLSDTDYGYPPELYPNLTYFSVPVNNSYSESRARYNGEVLQSPNSTLLLGPYHVNTTFSLLSLTMPVINNTSAIDVLGWLTIVCDARLIGSVIASAEGLGSTGLTLIVGPTNTTNHFPNGLLYSSSDNTSVPYSDIGGRFIWPLPKQHSDRHPGSSGAINPPSFPITKYPAVVTALTQDQHSMGNAGGDISTRDEAGKGVSVGFAIPDTRLVDWVVIVEQDKREVWQPIRHLRKVLLTCIFSVLGGVILFAWPLAHFASAPIRRLREATRRSVLPMGYSESNYSRDSHEMFNNNDGDGSNDEDPDAVIARKEGFFATVTSWNARKQRSRKERKEEHRRRQFHIPGKVKERKTCIQDELTDLTRTFNEMSDELMMQYERLEERVMQRTAELELSKKAAEAANESKTLFIANISHELKTPLNGILGMCAVCMQEEDPTKLKRSLGIIYKSGDLLLNLLTDLLTFSKNQVGQQLSLDSKEFRLREISSQVLAIFDKQAKEGQITLRVEFQGAESMNGIVFPSDEERTQHGPAGTGRVKDMILWGDVHRILQVVINLVSNSLKFTPAGGSVVLIVRCSGEAAEVNSRKTSLQSRSSKPISSRHKNSETSIAGPFGAKNSATANEINPYRERSDAYAQILASERPASPPPGRTLLFEFEVTDTGPGIAEHLQQRIFEPFVQGDLGLSKKFGGTGLGLSICSQLATLMKGTIDLESELGRGSTFTMRIPLRHVVTRSDSTASSVVGNNNDIGLEGSRSPQRMSQLITDDAQSHRSGHSHTSTGKSPTVVQAQAPNAQNYSNDAQPRLVGLSQPFFSSNQALESPGSQAAAMEKITNDAKDTGKIRVLVAEDNKVNQEVVLRMLKLEDIYDVTVAKDGQEALDFVRESMTIPGRHPYNLIFMDVQMPNLDGLQSTRLIREMGYDAPIVALTAFAEESNVKDCLDSGMNYFLSKPIRRPALKKVLKEYCPPIIEVDEEVSPMAEKPQPKPKPMAQPAPKTQEPLARSQSPPPRPMSPAISVHSIGNSGTRTTIVNQNSRPNSLDIPHPRFSGEH
ncbi:putative histidine kinase HHK5p [Aureobasidium subglaciale]|nr:putative histidine kinase HHK5p [Aureobasidium subglaciale]